MKLNEYQQLAARTRNGQMEKKEHLTNDGLGLSGEAGEVAGTIKKMVHHGHFYSVEKLAEELGDVLWYVADLATTMGISLESVALGNIAKLERRYPDGFNEERSINRDDGPASLNEVANEHIIYSTKTEGLVLADHTEGMGL